MIFEPIKRGGVIFPTFFDPPPIPPPAQKNGFQFFLGGVLPTKNGRREGPGGGKERGVGCWACTPGEKSEGATGVSVTQTKTKNRWCPIRLPSKIGTPPRKWGQNDVAKQRAHHHEGGGGGFSSGAQPPLRGQGGPEGGGVRP